MTDARTALEKHIDALRREAWQEGYVAGWEAARECIRAVLNDPDVFEPPEETPEPDWSSADPEPEPPRALPPPVTKQIATDPPSENNRPKEYVRKVPITDKQSAVWRAVATLSDRGDAINHATIAIEAGVPLGSVGFILDALQRKGMIWANGRGRGRVYHVLKHPDGGPTKPAPPETPKALRRFTVHRDLNPEQVNGLPDDHPAVIEGRTLFPDSVTNPQESPRLLVSGINSPKLGSKVVKGPWKGMPIYMLTLEERATCPRSCHHYLTCYGNGMPRARRHKHGGEMELLLAHELDAKQREHPDGFVVRLHQLGDFYSVDYVRHWGEWLRRFPALHVFGYTAWLVNTEIGRAVAELHGERPDRWVVRTSSDKPDVLGVTTIWRVPEGPRVKEGIVCPAQTGATDCCGTCGLCWSPNALDETIVFVAHGRLGKIAEKKPEPKVAPKPEKPHRFVTTYPPADYDKDVLASLQEMEAWQKFDEPKTRRCQSCQQLFMCERVGELLCKECTPAVAARKHGAMAQGGAA